MLRIFLFCLLLSQVVACQLFMPIENNNNMKEKYVWRALYTAPEGYPIGVYSGGFILGKETYVYLYGAIAADEDWGDAYNGMEKGSGFPNHLKVTWISFAEDCEYRIDVPLDAQKIEDIFKEKYLIRNVYGDLMKKDYNKIVAGFAPGGVVSVWVKGGEESHEVGFFKGEKIKIPRSITDSLEPSERNWFDPAYRKKIMETPAAVPREVQEKNKNKPIPYGLWDRYRNHYQWKPVFTLPKPLPDKEETIAQIYDISFKYLNGEAERIYYPNTLHLEAWNRAIPRSVHISWTGVDGTNFAADIFFDEEEIMKVFERFSPQDNLELEFYINHYSTYIAVFLTEKEKKIGINDNTQIDIWTLDKNLKRD